MFINEVTSHFVDNWGRVMKRTTTYGKYKNYHIAIDNYRYKGDNILQKRFVIWNDKMQKIVNYFRKEDGGFKRIG